MDDQLDVILNILVIALFAVGVAWGVSIASQRPQRKKKCIHKWSVHPETNKLTCLECHYVAGTTDPTE